MKKYTYVPGSFIAAWLIWELIVRLGGFNEALLPTPYKVLLGFGELIGDGVLFKDVADSLVRFFIGYIISVVAGVFLGLILGWYKGIWNYINPIVQVIRPISPVAWCRLSSCSSVSDRRRPSSSSLSRHFSQFYCPRCPRFRISTPYTSRWLEILVSSSRNCYLKLYCPPCFPVLHRDFTSRSERRGSSW